VPRGKWRNFALHGFLATMVCHGEECPLPESATKRYPRDNRVPAPRLCSAGIPFGGRGRGTDPRTPSAQAYG